MSGNLADILKLLTGASPAQQKAVHSLLQTASAQQPADLTQQHNTPLAPEQEAQFQAWLRQRSAAEGRDVSADLATHDLRGAWAANPQAATSAELLATFKKPTPAEQSQPDRVVGPGGAPIPIDQGQTTMQTRPALRPIPPTQPGVGTSWANPAPIPTGPLFHGTPTTNRT